MASKKIVKPKKNIKAKPAAKKPVAKTAQATKAKAKKPVAKPVKKAAPKPVKKVTKPVAKAKPKPKAKPIAKSQKTVKGKPAPAPKKNIKQKPAVAKKAAPKPVKKAAPVKAKPAKKAVVNTKAKKAAPVIKKKAAPAKPVAKKPAAKTKPVAKNTKTKITKPAKQVKQVKPIPAPKKKEAAKKTSPPPPPAKKTAPVKKAAPVKEPKAAVKKPAPVKSVAEKPEKKTPENKAGEIREKVKSSRRSKKGKKKTGGEEDEPKMDGFDPLVEELIATTKKSKQPKVPKVKAPIKLMPTVKIEAAVKEHVIPKNFRNGGKEEFQMEFFVKSSPRILFNFISSPSGLSEWFANNVNIKNGVYTFFWEDSQEQARLLFTREFEIMRFKWTHTDSDDTYFELKIKVDELTGDVALIVTDFARKEELQESQLLWETQIHDLMKALGS